MNTSAIWLVVVVLVATNAKPVAQAIESSSPCYNVERSIRILSLAIEF